MGISQDFNPFANQEIHVPKAYQEDLRTYSGTFNTDGKPDGASKAEEAPFKRYIDFWLVAAAVGAAEELFVPVDSGDRHSFITGAVLQRDLASIEFLLLLAIGHTEDPFVVKEPRKVLDVAEGFAAGGIPLIKEMMDSGHLPPLQNLTRSLVKTFR